MEHSLWACIALPDLALDCVLRKTSDPDQPLVLVGGHPQQRELLAVNAAARAAGLQPGQRLTVAQAIVHDFTTITHDPAEADRWQEFLASWAYRFSSKVFAGWPAAIVLEVRSSLGLFGGWQRLATLLRADLHALRFRHALALAPTPRAAHVLAGLRDGLAVTQAAQLQATLDGIPIRQARLPGNAGEQLHKVGIRHLRQLFAMPRDGLRRRFGQELLDHLDRLRGASPEPLQYYQPPEHFDMRVALNYGVDSHQPLLFPTRRLLSDLATFLASRGSGVQHFVLKLEHEGQTPTRLEIGLLAAERDAALLFELTRTRLEQVELPEPVIALRLLARQLPPFLPTGRELFDERPVGYLPWEHLREKLRARLGNEAIHRVSECADPRPERAWQRGDHAPAALPELPPRPTWLLPQPVPLQDKVARIIAGPERLESGWWDGKDARRDYYVLETIGGQHAWAFTPVGRNGPWMLHGWFA